MFLFVAFSGAMVAVNVSDAPTAREVVVLDNETPVTSIGEGATLFLPIGKQTQV